MAKRQKTVFDRDMVAHVWAQQTQDEGRTSSGNFYFEGPFLYSYRDGYPVGRIFKDLDVALIWSGTYSVTTSRHTSIAQRAVHGRYKHVLIVPHLGSRWGYEASEASMHARNVEALTKDLREGTEKALKRSHQPGFGSLRHTLERDGSYYLPGLASKIRTYCQIFNVEAPPYVAAWDGPALLAQYDTNHAAALAKGEAARAKLLARLGSEEAVNAYHARQDMLSRATSVSKAAEWIARGEFVRYDVRDHFNATLIELREHLAANPNDATVQKRLAAFSAAIKAEEDRAAAQAAELARVGAIRLEIGALSRADRDAIIQAGWDAETAHGIAFTDRRVVLIERAQIARGINQQEDRETARRLESERRATFAAMTPDEQTAAVQTGTYPRSWLDAAQSLALWRTGAPRIGGLYNIPPALRLRPSDPATVETSHGAHFPADHARRVWPLLCRIRATGAAWSRPDNHQTTVGHFRVDAIASDGTVAAGCHRIPWAEIEHLAALLGLRPMSEIVASPDTVSDAA